MNSDLAIVNGLLVDSSGIYPGVLYVHGGKITAITRDLEGTPRR